MDLCTDLGLPEFSHCLAWLWAATDCDVKVTARAAADLLRTGTQNAAQTSAYIMTTYKIMIPITLELHICNCKHFSTWWACVKRIVF